MTSQNTGAKYFFKVNKDYTLGTPSSMSSSERTIDMQFKDLAQSYDLQSALKLASASIIKSAWNYPLSGPDPSPEEILNDTARFLAAFEIDPKQQELKRKYLSNNGTVRLLVSEENLLKKVRGIIGQ